MIALGGGIADAQVVGIVRDAETGDALAFAYVLGLQSQQGCFSGLDGRFSLAIAGEHDSLRVQLLGYVPQTVAVTAGRSVVIDLQPGGVDLDDVVINPTENPALRIVRNAVAQRNANDPLNRSDFSFDTYNKLTGEPIYPATVPDSQRLPFHIFLSETVTHRLQVRPGKVQEEIVSARLAGYPGKVIPFTASDLQDLSFYSNYVGVFGQQFLSPISPPGLNQYLFSLRDTVVVGEDSIFTIDFEPRGDRFDGFRGNLRIHSHDWALITVDVDLVSNEGGLLIQGGGIRQIYRQLEGGEWVPSELHTEVDTKALSGGSPIRFHLSGYSSMRRQQLGVQEKGYFRPEDELVVAPGAGVEDSLLQVGRPQPLTEIDLRSYRTLDSLGRKLGLPQLLDQTWKLADGRLGVGVVDVVLDRLFTQNRVEKTRLGIGLATNEKMTRRLSLGGFIGWGLYDRVVKYGADVQVTPLGDDRIYAGASYAQDLVESGFRRLGVKPDRGLHQDIYRESGIRRWYLTDMDYVETREAWVGVRLPSDLGLRLSRRWEAITPAYDYAFDDSSRFRLDEVEGLLRWAPGARYIQNQGRKVLTSNKAPIFYLRYTQGLATVQGDYAYRAAAVNMTYRFAAFRGGKATIVVNAGWNDRSLPRSRMRVYRSNFAKGNFSDLQGAFNTMRYDEFAADMYAEGFVYLSPKLRWLHIGKRIHPQVNLAMAAAWGDLYAPSNGLHAPAPLRAPDKFYLEPGITITRLLPTPKVDNLISAWIRGIGVGVYYRVGAYSLPTVKENIAFRLSLGGL